MIAGGELVVAEVGPDRARSERRGGGAELMRREDHVTTATTQA